MYFHSVKARFFRAPGGLPKRLHQLPDLWDGQCLGHRPNPRIWDGGRGNDLSAGIFRAGSHAPMMDLERKRSAMLVGGPGEPPKARDEAIIVDAKLCRNAPATGIDGGRPPVEAEARLPEVAVTELPATSQNRRT